ncbi:MAG: DUF1501 domain-containing protein [Xanthomonadales bacterium]|nr:DUF1501 domain-containing protein [Xanthomonadales bacterium]
MTTSHSRSRRLFLRNATCLTAGAVAGGAWLGRFGLIGQALAQGCPPPGAVDDYRALVCVFLFGGNDSFNLIVPSDAARHAVYATSRGAMALDAASLHALDVTGGTNGHAYGVHPRCAGLAELFNRGDGAFVVNAGTLLEPTTKAAYADPDHPLPPQLFSHNDQQAQWQYGRAEANGSVGWGGLVADRLHVLNVGASLPMSISLNGQNRFQAGATVQPYAMSGAGAAQLVDYPDGSVQRQALEALVEQAHPDPLTRSYARTLGNALEYSRFMQGALDAVPPLATVFPGDNSLATSLAMVARVIAARTTLAARRQVFFVSLGGFDTHADQLDEQPDLLGTLSDALLAFDAAMHEIGTHGAVTTFTMSEFARTLNSDGNGTDHAWGGNQFVMGGAVRGQRLYGTPGANGDIFPDLVLDGPDSLARGQMIPSTASDQYAATLARWLGVAECDLATIFPYLATFPRANLGFLD